MCEFNPAFSAKDKASGDVQSEDATAMEVGTPTQGMANILVDIIM